MYAVCVTVHVKPEKVNEFRAAIVANAENTRKEAGNLRFDVLQSLSEPTHFILNEVYQSEQAFQDHQKTQHYFTWRETVTDWMAEPRSAVKCGVVFPAEKAEW